MSNRIIAHLALWPRAVIAVVALLITFVSAREATASVEADVPWFQPTLTSKNDVVCDAIVAGARSHATDYDGLKAAPTFFSGDDRGNSSVQSVPDHPELLALVRRGAKPLYVEHIRNPGCGGACETESLGLHATAQSDEGQTGSSTPASEGWTIYESNSKHHLAVGVVDRQLEVYRAGSDAQWHLACRVQLEPDLNHSADPEVQKATASLHSLRDAAEDIARGEGYGMCGTMHTDGRWAGDFQHALDQVLFDPNATAISNQIPSENSYGDYPRIYEALQDWSLGGIFEYRALQRYDAQLNVTTVTVKDFYQYAFHWSAPQSLEMAQTSLPNAVSHRFGFYMYSPYSVPGERELRRALLTHQPISAIHAIAIDLHALDKASHDSILNVAVEYPEALSYLLAQGANSNLANEFGKTPLMYAAQYDQLQALQILLRAGADPNATTIVAPDNCGYAIQKHNVTALHYAVKFASRKVAQALLDAGAMNYIRTEHYIDPSQGSYPLEWLQMDGNPNLSAEDIKALEGQLQLPSESERKGFSVSLTAAAESANSAGRTVEAYQKIRLAGIADPTNGRAIADFPVLALKAGAVGPALEGSARAITNAKTDADRAAGLFNQGLACLQNTSPMAIYKNVSYCQNGAIDPFVQAWKVQPSPARTNKLLQLLGSNEPTNCVMPFPGAKTVAFRFYAIFDQRVPSGQVERIYAMHPASLTIDPKSIRWQPNISPPKTVTPHVVEILNVNHDYNVTILDGDYFATSISVNDGKCDLGNSAASQRPR